MILNHEDILEILPHRYPMLLVDRIVELEPMKRAVGIKNATFNELFFQGHFPGWWYCFIVSRRKSWSYSDVYRY